SHGAAGFADARIHGARARAVGGARPLPAQRPVAWHGYGLGDWADRWETFARRAATADWELTGNETLARHRRGRSPQTPPPPKRPPASRKSRRSPPISNRRGIASWGRHSACTPAAFMTAAHLSRSAARNAANSSGEEILASTPSLTKVLAISGDCRLALMAAL